MTTVSLVIYNFLLGKRPVGFADLSLCIGEEISPGWDVKDVWLGLCCWNPWILTLFRAKCIKIATLFKTLKSELEYFFLRLKRSHTPMPCRAVHNEWAKHESFYMLWRLRSKWMHLLMTTYRQHIMTTFGCGRDKSTVFTHFLGQFSKIYTSVLVNCFKFYAKDQFHYIIVQD